MACISCGASPAGGAGESDIFDEFGMTKTETEEAIVHELRSYCSHAPTSNSVSDPTTGLAEKLTPANNLAELDLVLNSATSTTTLAQQVCSSYAASHPLALA